ncbi:hypothetical protein BEL04_11495 [Mucilaginibacter sp. PPCGB 2223]|uniref:outer membrane beta-barrel protein n=1 Tax=Mucilaginibacter sp. PPCGB 2223 TaxID=1886027 RepID=UPI0008267A7D|nr:outer membrane beta-barrel protein [Mucilaginibacter sp. PPCGB 2223]OCX52113.1 hypothetical protein BEL04_11495 [Mucilaginibacter sp. PPCGB 2223]
MKNSIKIAALLVAIMGSSLASKAQSNKTGNANGVILNVAAESGISLGDARDLHKWGLGGSIGIDIPVANQLFATANAGYQNNFGIKNVAGTGLTATNDHLLPVKAGLKYFPVSILYIQGEAGAIFSLNKDDAGYAKNTAFLYTPTIGVQLPLSRSSYLDAGIQYKGSTKFNNYDNSRENMLGLHVAYAFSVK